MIVYVDVTNLKPIKEIEEVRRERKESLLLVDLFKKEGFNPAISKLLINEDNEIIDGYERLKICKQLKIQKVPVEIYQVETKNKEIRTLEYVKMHLLRNFKEYEDALEKIEEIDKKIEEIRKEKLIVKKHFPKAKKKEEPAITIAKNINSFKTITFGGEL